MIENPERCTQCEQGKPTISPFILTSCVEWHQNSVKLCIKPLKMFYEPNNRTFKVLLENQNSKFISIFSFKSKRSLLG